ncbi:hypothetical protein ACFYZ2_27100 [Streptomyces sviceus]|uniref:hypothetical protein n=1 Tax=Streptomyces sviceus TaxID=285530 RepID=UPI0036B3B425
MSAAGLAQVRAGMRAGGGVPPVRTGIGGRASGVRLLAPQAGVGASGAVSGSRLAVSVGEGVSLLRTGSEVWQARLAASVGGGR